MARSSRTQTIAAAMLAGTLLLVGLVGLYEVLRYQPRPLLERIQHNGTLVVATRRSPTAYYDGANGPDGFEHALTQLFAKHLGVRIRYVFPSNVEALFKSVARGSVHMAAAALTVTAQREQRVHFSTPYEFVTEQVIYRRGSKRPASLDEIDAGDIHVVAGSSHEETLQQLRDDAHPTLTWQREPGTSNENLLARVDSGDIRLTVADSNSAALSRRVFRYAATAFDLGDARPIAWAFSKASDDSLLDAANDFLAVIQNDGTLQRLRARFFGHTGRLNFVDTREFWRSVRDRLPALRPYFEQAAAETGLDWRLLAAIGYQESHWRSDAVSPTGVRGIMMLTRSTAQRVGVSDREDPQQSIIGGAKYLKIVEKKIPQRIRGPNRLWLTLAGYNIGFGHLEDARVLTDRDGANPDLWMEVKQRLPLLAKAAHHKTVRHGFARGQEAVDYVDNIRNYYDLLVWFTTTRDKITLARLLADEPDTTNGQ